MRSSHLWSFFGVRKQFRGELNPPVVEWLNKGLISVSSLSERAAGTHPDVEAGHVHCPVRGHRLLPHRRRLTVLACQSASQSVSQVSQSGSQSVS
eukprot:4680763-Pyramimonas_sp.AAC.1